MPDTPKKDKIENLERRLGYRFDNRARLNAALTHSSTGYKKNYERLEFLGDRVLGLIMADILFKRFPEESEGDLAKRHAALVQGPTLSRKARSLDLGSVMLLSESERAAGGADNDNILSDGFEALLGALYLDAGLEKTATIIKALWGDTIHTVTEPPQDPKTALQEWAQARGLPLPKYEIIDREGPDHAPVFTVRVSIVEKGQAHARGTARRGAEKDAARLLYDKLQNETE